ncbi:hypothetical protein [Microbacterium xanthum]|uniref:hypothetical protein n=1 Tax=Microbacterium xanthum TaxID=3079794 RepID=UPI002AD2DAC7|nr:hypothetical protein [Microbacterium sp. KSW-48]MDZ8172591.1 hypothetical protein [Microbacterium sp. KSW-48]
MDEDAAVATLTLVVDLPVTKTDALDVIALACHGEVVGARTPHPRVGLTAHEWAEVEVPKFGDPPPLAIDVHSTRGERHARGAARDLAAGLARLGWTAHLAGH